MGLTIYSIYQLVQDLFHLARLDSTTWATGLLVSPAKKDRLQTGGVGGWEWLGLKMWYPPKMACE